MPAPYRLMPASKDPVRQLLFFIGADYWFTYRLPGQVMATITYPDHLMTRSQAAAQPTVAHERIHAEQLHPWWAPWVMALGASILPLPVLISGRWLIERPAYLADIKAGRCTIDEAVDALWGGYLIPWLPFLMRRWFKKHA